MCFLLRKKFLAEKKVWQKIIYGKKINSGSWQLTVGRWQLAGGGWQSVGGRWKVACCPTVWGLWERLVLGIYTGHWDEVKTWHSRSRKRRSRSRSSSSSAINIQLLMVQSRKVKQNFDRNCKVEVHKSHRYERDIYVLIRCSLQFLLHLWSRKLNTFAIV